MLFRETVAVYCENHTEHTDTVPHRKHFKYPLQSPTGLMLFRKTVAVYCENHTEHTNTLFGKNAEFQRV
jgi:translation initiation factor IF-1